MNTSTSNIKVACYCRLSREDAKLGESVSIETQKKVLEDYCRNENLPVYDYYVDDGYTGTNFERPGFKRMMTDIKAGKINYVIVKDLSRLGREHIMVGQYIQKTFPEMGVHFLALADDVDTSNVSRRQTDNIMTSVKNIFNEMWPAETSDKVRTAFEAKAARGEFIGSQAPYGYIKSAKDKHVLVRDEQTAPTVQWIFEMAANCGYGYNKIARVLTERKIITPGALQAQRAGRDYPKDPYEWNLATVSKMFENEVYLGTVTSFKRRKVSYKTKKEAHLPQDSWSVNRNMHEPIISEELWNAAHEKLSARKRTCSPGMVNIFAGLVKCEDCGYALGISNQKGRTPYFACNTYKKKGKDKCSFHHIRYDTLYEYVLADMRALINSYKADKESFKANLCRRFDESVKEVDYEAQISAIKVELDKNAEKLNILYTDRSDGIISREQFATQAAFLNEESKQLNEKLSELRKMLDQGDSAERGIKNFIDLLEEHEHIDMLDTELLNRFVEKIFVGEKRLGNDGSIHQRITIKYRFFGET